jgi:hypothetical protein
LSGHAIGPEGPFSYYKTEVYEGRHGYYLVKYAIRLKGKNERQVVRREYDPTKREDVEAVLQYGLDTFLARNYNWAQVQLEL